MRRRSLPQVSPSQPERSERLMHFPEHQIPSHQIPSRSSLLQGSSSPPAPPQPKMIGVSASRRQRMIEARVAAPHLMRFPARAGEFMSMQSNLFHHFISICSNQPLAYGKYCDSILAQFPFVLQGLHSRDTPQRICLNLDFCTQDSYAAAAPHALEMMPATQI